MYGESTGNNMYRESTGNNMYRESTGNGHTLEPSPEPSGIKHPHQGKGEGRWGGQGML